MLDSNISIGNRKIAFGPDLKNVLDYIYCSSAGFEVSHTPEDEYRWLSERIESVMTMDLSAETKTRIAQILLESEAFDAFMQKRFSQVKRYGLDGCESTVVALDTLLQIADGVDHAMIAMPHRGRLNLMTVLMNYPPEAIFHKLTGNSELPDGFEGSADVLSHLSLQNEVMIAGKPGMITLLSNPSHLEAGNPVGLGATYGYQKYQQIGKKCLSVQFHGDAAFSGQGVVSECLQLSQLPNFSVDGTIHIITNNQLGFTTSEQDGRSSRYASDSVKAIDAPIVHVNADRPEEVVKAMVLAYEYQQKFKKDVVVDIIGWRKMGHNELDEPSFTQPLMYKTISKRASTAHEYSQKHMETSEIDRIKQAEHAKLEKSYQRVKENGFKPKLILIQKDWESKDEKSTGVEKEILISLGKESVKHPDNFNLHPRLAKHHVENRLEQIKKERIDWATAEAMAIGSLLREGRHVRLCGQDVGRGTFSQRHLRFIDQVTEQTWEPLSTISPGRLEIVQSNLSEFAVLGFEYGVSIVAENVLPIWEAQFGDFVNGAQVILDTFISSGEAKWGLQSNLTLLLPHGYDGAGPEHSSCRLERFLQSCDESELGNWIVCNPTTPANYFHLLRRQTSRKYRKPLIIAGPKTLLRLPAAISPISDMLPNTDFKPILVDSPGETTKVKEIIFMTGKFYYEVKRELESVDVDLKTKNKMKEEELVFIRIEELNPFPAELIQEAIHELKLSKEYRITWCQEEPKNMGAYAFVSMKLKEALRCTSDIRYVGREASGAPATGISSRHKTELKQIFSQLF